MQEATGKQKSFKSRTKPELAGIIRKMEKAIKLKCYDCQHSKRNECGMNKESMGFCPLYKYSPWAKRYRSKQDK